MTLAVAVLMFFSPAAPRPDIQLVAMVFKGLAIAAAFPALWMLLQMVTIPLGSIDHPIWGSAAAALDERLAGHISLDIGYTFRSLFRYLSLLPLVFITAVLTRARERADTILFALCAVTCLMSFELILIYNSSAQKPDSLSTFSTPLIGSCAIGVILNVASITRAVERYQTRGQRHQRGGWIYGSMMLLSAAAAIFCLVPLIYVATFNVVLAVAFGLMTMFLVIVIDRLNLRRWYIGIACIAALVIASGAIALRFSNDPSATPLLRFAKVDSDTVTLRMISDANWKGSGVGTYNALQRIYLDYGTAPASEPPNTIASMLLEWGGGGLIIAAGFIAQLFVVLFTGALSRGRDSFFSASAAACVTVAFFEAFCDPSFTYLTVQMLLAIAVGLGLSQTKGRSFPHRI
jgi:hypothetical protein